jgi:2'-5' RNA ligase
LGYTLFLAIFPSSNDAHHLALAAADLRSRHWLGGTALPPGRLQLSLHALAGFIDTIPQAVLDAAIAASASVACPPLPIVFDQVLSFTQWIAQWRWADVPDAAASPLGDVFA